MKNLIPAFVVSLCLSACASWPQHGHSGAAELEISPVHKTQEQMRLWCAKKELNTLQEQGVKDHFPAAFIIANIQWTRAARTVGGGFLKSSRTDLNQLDVLIRGLHTNLKTHPPLRAELLP